jgi:acyl-CoA thioesterase
MMAADVALRSSGIELIERGDGHARTRMAIGEHMVNDHGKARGALILSLADTAFACNSWGSPSVDAGADIVSVAAGRVCDVLDAHARMRARYSRHGIYDVTARGAGGVIAEFRGRSVRLSETRV